MLNALFNLTRSLIYGLAATIFISSLSGCTQVRKKLEFETTAQIDFAVAGDVNPNTEGRPSPVVVKLFKLADSRQFKQQDFLALYENAKERLGVDLLETVHLKEFAPNEQRTEQLKLTPNDKFIGILVEYSRYQEANATLVLPLESYKANHFRIKLTHLDIQKLQEGEFKVPENNNFRASFEENESEFDF